MRKDGRLQGVPAGVSALIGERLAQLEPATREALETAALLGRELTLPVLADACGAGREELRARLRLPLATGILEESEDGRVRFAHGLYRERLLADLAPDRRARPARAAGRGAAALAQRRPPRGGGAAGPAPAGRRSGRRPGPGDRVGPAGGGRRARGAGLRPGGRAVRGGARRLRPPAPGGPRARPADRSGARPGRGPGAGGGGARSRALCLAAADRARVAGRRRAAGPGRAGPRGRAAHRRGRRRPGGAAGRGPARAAGGAAPGCARG